MGKLFFSFLFSIFNKSIVGRELNFLKIFVEDTIIAIMLCLDGGGGGGEKVRKLKRK